MLIEFDFDTFIYIRLISNRVLIRHQRGENSPETKEFKDNTIDTSWLDGLIREKSIQTISDPEDVAVAACIARAYARTKEEETKFLQSLEKGQVSTSAINDIKRNKCHWSSKRYFIPMYRKLFITLKTFFNELIRI